MLAIRNNNSNIYAALVATIIAITLSPQSAEANSYCTKGTIYALALSEKESNDIANKIDPGDVPDKIVNSIFSNCASGDIVSIPDDQQVVIGSVCDFDKTIVPMPYEPDQSSIGSKIVMCAIRDTTK